MTADQIPGDAALTPAERADLRTLAGLMIPASAQYGVPGADDDAIQADILATAGRDAADLRAALAKVALLAGAPLAKLDPDRSDAVIRQWRAGCPAATTLSRVILQCYYRDDRVLRSLSIEPRAPFPKGHQLEQGDWSLLEPVKARPQMWRRAP